MPDNVNIMSSSGLTLFNTLQIVVVLLAVAGIWWLKKDNKRVEDEVQARRKARKDRHAKA